MRLESESLSEGWVNFSRLHCSSGFIDRYAGDQAHNPNSPTKGGQQLNTFRQWWRFNGGEWICERDLGGSVFHHINDMRTAGKTAQEILELLTIK